ncbi:MAG: CHAD domain-containing protein, partial [Bacteroidota bacterium]
MEENTLLKQFHTRMTEFKQSTQHFEEERDIEDVRLLRVVIKKLWALLTFTEQLTNKEFKKKQHWELLKPVFKRAGKLRDIHVNREKAMEKRPYCAKPYSVLLESREKKEERKLNLIIDDLDVNKLDELNNNLVNMLEKYTDDEILEAANQYVERKLTKVKKLRNEAGSDK